MVQVSYPGVYVQEVPSGSRTITGVATSIALFIGMAKRGPLWTPVRVLSFTEFERTFSADDSMGELPHQVRQFFLNGGQQAIVVRVADGAQSSSATLGGLVLTSIGAGADEDGLRAAVDFNTDQPEGTFNLTLYRESFDATGNATVSQQETHNNLSLVAGHPRFAPGIINQNSNLATATFSVVGSVGDGVSYSGRLFGNAGDVPTAITAAIGGRIDGRFTIKIGTAPVRTVVLDPASVAAADVQDAIETATTVDGHSAFPTVAYVQPGGSGPYVLQVTAPDQDVVLGSASVNDIAAALGLGVANGGYEVGSLRSERPDPRGLVSQSLPFQLAATPLSDFTNAFSLTGPESFQVPANAIEFPGPGPNLADGAAGSIGLVNVRENLDAIAAAINAVTSRWRAEVHGFRLVVTPLFGNANTGSSASFAGTNTGINALFAGVTANSAAEPFNGGQNGSKPSISDYRAAFANVDSNVDLFNILVLPRSAEDVDGTDRADVWGEASAFCQRRRAVLLVDAAPTVNSVTKALPAAKKLRIGLAKDHSALYWPRVEVNPDGTRRFIDPSGSIAGLMARIDASRGVWKAPAGVEAELRGTLGLEVTMSDTENGLLNPEAVNAIRIFPNGLVSWGARTMDGFDNSGNDDYKYLPVRRLALFIAESLQRGLKFAVFEPNDEPLWAQIRLAAGGFMNTLFRRGAFQGSTAREAYFVKVDSETTTQNDINLGIVNVVVGFAPVKPAEFVVVTLKQQAGQIQI
jgi:phage tail sheath protein FI